MIQHGAAAGLPDTLASVFFRGRYVGAILDPGCRATKPSGKSRLCSY